MPRLLYATFERRVDMPHADGSVTRGFIDLYRRGCFILEAKQTGKELDSGGWNSAMLRAQNQADQYNTPALSQATKAARRLLSSSMSVAASSFTMSWAA